MFSLQIHTLFLHIFGAKYFGNKSSFSKPKIHSEEANPQEETESRLVVAEGMGEEEMRSYLLMSLRCSLVMMKKL